MPTVARTPKAVPTVASTQQAAAEFAHSPPVSLLGAGVARTRSIGAIAEMRHRAMPLVVAAGVGHTRFPASVAEAHKLAAAVAGHIVWTR